MIDPEKYLAEINALLRLVDEHRGAIHLLLVVNTKTKYSLSNDYPDFSVRTEYLSDNELTELLNGFRGTGVLTDLYVGEMSFVEAICTPLLRDSDQQLLVYSTVPSGTWHGRDSLIPALCGLMGIGCCSGDPYAMAVAGNKYYGLRLAERIGEDTAGVWLYQRDLGWCNGCRPSDNERVIVKPTFECASIGIGSDSVRLVDSTFEEFLRDRARLLDQPMLVQTFIPGYEIEVPVFGTPEPIAPAAFGIAIDGSPLMGDTFLTYNDVYDERYTYYPATDLDNGIADSLRESACRVFRELGLYGFARIDYRVRDDGSWAITDINAIPHLIPGSSSHRAFETLGLTYPEMLKLVVAAGLKRRLNPKA